MTSERKCPECKQWVEIEDGRYTNHGTTGNHDAIGYEMPCPLSGGEVCDEWEVIEILAPGQASRTEIERENTINR